MDFLFNLCVTITLSVVAGGLVGVLTEKTRESHYTDTQKARGEKLWKTGSRIMTYFTCLFLLIGFIWSVYYLVLGAVSPEQAEYASNMSSLIVSVLTVVSIAFAFYEFIRRK